MEYTHEKCCDTGILSASLVKEEKTNNNLYISVVLCDHFDPTTEANIEALGSTGLAVNVKTGAELENAPSQE